MTDGTNDETGAPSSPDVQLRSTIVDELPVGVYRTTADGEFVDVNDAFLDLVGADAAADLDDHRVSDVYDDPADRATLLRTLEADGVVRDHEFQIRTLDGARRWVATRAVRHDVGDGYHVEGIVDDITDQRDAEAEAAEYRQRLTQITETSTDVLWMFSGDFEELLFVNDAYEDVWGRPVEELERDPPSFLTPVHTEDRTDLEDAIERVRGGEHASVEYRIVRPDGSVRWLWSKGAPVTDENGTVFRLAGFTRDVTDRKRREDELREYRERLEVTVTDLEQSNEELEQFAYVASHDLQEPLRMVASFVDLLAEEYEGELDEEADEYIGYAVDGASRMKAMIDGLLRYSRVHTQADDPVPVDSEAVLDEVLRDLELLAEERGIAVTYGTLPAVRADRSQLGQVFQNLLANAIQYGDESVHVDAVERDGTVTVSVTDDGLGIPPADQEEMFEIFRRGGDESGNGSGIGLAIVRRIVQLHGGDVRIESDCGEGTTVHVTLPAVAEVAG